MSAGRHRKPPKTHPYKQSIRTPLRVESSNFPYPFPQGLTNSQKIKNTTLPCLSPFPSSPPTGRLCRNPFLIIASDRRERGNLSFQGPAKTRSPRFASMTPLEDFFRDHSGCLYEKSEMGLGYIMAQCHSVQY